MDLVAHEKLITGEKKKLANMILDGAIDKSCYELASPRILWVLREAHENKAGDIADYRDFVGHKLETYPYWRRTLGPVAKASYGILGGCLDYSHLPNDIDNLKNALCQVAIVNVNKVGGDKTSPPTHMKRVAEVHGSTIKSQIELLDPHIVIFAGTFGYLQRAVPGLGDGNGRIHVAACHPNQRSMSQQKYYETIRDDVRRLMKVTSSRQELSSYLSKLNALQ